MVVQRCTARLRTGTATTVAGGGEGTVTVTARSLTRRATARGRSVASHTTTEYTVHSGARPSSRPRCRKNPPPRPASRYTLKRVGCEEAVLPQAPRRPHQQQAEHHPDRGVEADAAPPHPGHDQRVAARPGEGAADRPARVRSRAEVVGDLVGGAVAQFGGFALGLADQELEAAGEHDPRHRDAGDHRDDDGHHRLAHDGLGDPPHDPGDDNDQQQTDHVRCDPFSDVEHDRSPFVASSRLRWRHPTGGAANTSVTSHVPSPRSTTTSDISSCSSGAVTSTTARTNITSVRPVA